MRKAFGIVVYVGLIIGMINSVFTLNLNQLTVLGILLLCNIAIDGIRTYMEV